MAFGARARIRLDAIQGNLQTIRATAPGAKVMAVVKANAYGHGLVPIADALAAADSLAVARLSEARQLRAAGVEKAITLLGGVLSAGDLSAALDLEIDVGFHHEDQVRWAERCGRRVPMAWLKIDTGMGRLGIAPPEAADAIGRLGRCADRLGLLSHFASADELDRATTREQIACFVETIDRFDGDVSIANSAALLGWRDELDAFSARADSGRLWIRPGLSLYGISPFPDRLGAELGLKAAMQFEATLMSVKRLPAGSPVGYGGTWRSEQDTWLGIVAGGYGDGYSRFIPSGTPVLVNGRRVPVAGRISMDLTSVDLGPGAEDSVGDPVVFWGDELPVEQIAEAAGTIAYQLVTGVTHREAAIYE